MRVEVPPIQDDVTPDLPRGRMIIKAKLGIGREQGCDARRLLGRLTRITLCESPEKTSNQN